MSSRLECKPYRRVPRFIRPDVDEPADNYKLVPERARIHTMAWWIASERSSRMRGMLENFDWKLWLMEE